MKLTNDEELKCLEIGTLFQDFILKYFPPTIETQKAIFRISAAFAFSKKFNKVRFLEEMEEAYDFFEELKGIKSNDPNN